MYTYAHVNSTADKASLGAQPPSADQHEVDQRLFIRSLLMLGRLSLKRTPVSIDFDRCYCMANSTTLFGKSHICTNSDIVC